MTGELIVPVLISLGLMTLMLKALAFPEFRLQRAHARSSARQGPGDERTVGLRRRLACRTSGLQGHDVFLVQRH